MRNVHRRHVGGDGDYGVVLGGYFAARCGQRGIVRTEMVEEINRFLGAIREDNTVEGGIGTCQNLDSFSVAIDDTGQRHNTARNTAGVVRKVSREIDLVLPTTDLSGIN